MEKRITVSFLLWLLVSCSNITQPLPSAIPTSHGQEEASPAETLQSLPSAVATLETSTSAMPEPGDILRPQGTPVQEWRGIPIMPEATAGQEFSEDNSYSFRTNISVKDVQDFYNERLAALGWSQPFNTSLDANGGTIVFRKEGRSLAVTVIPSEDSLVILLVLTQA